MPAGIAAAYAGASLAALALFAWDKAQARRGGRRVSEFTLHAVEVVGGWPGALLAARLFRHKTRKRSYRAVTWAIVALHLVGWWWWWRRSAG